jgi:formylglycine-generating enzyme required for sulfatase activity
VPVIAWVDVPAGEFVLGEGEEAHRFTLPAYRISEYPITNAQYRAFVEGGGYTDEWHECWTADGWAWKGDRPGPDDGLPLNFLLPNHPRVNVTWYEAYAFCQWLSKQHPDYKGARLPTEAEWEKAARGTDGRRYSWGDEFDAGRCNTDETGIGQTSAVGMFPSGASPYGALDLSGNVWEWTTSNWGESYSEPDFKYPYNPDDGRDDVSAGSRVLRVLRGGSFINDQRYARAAFRDRNRPFDRYFFNGFRPAAPILLS